MENSRSLTPDEVAAILNITKQTVYDMIKRQELPAYRIGRKLRIDPRDVDLYRSQGKNFELPSSRPRIPEISTALPSAAGIAVGLATDKLVVCGQDIILDLLARQLEKNSNRCESSVIRSGVSMVYQPFIMDRLTWLQSTCGMETAANTMFPMYVICSRECQSLSSTWPNVCRAFMFGRAIPNRSRAGTI